MHAISSTGQSFCTGRAHPVGSVCQHIMSRLLIRVRLLSIGISFTCSPLCTLNVIAAFSHFVTNCRPRDSGTSVFGTLYHSIRDSPRRCQNSTRTVGTTITNRAFSDFGTVFSGLNRTTRDNKLHNALNAITAGRGFGCGQPFNVKLCALLRTITRPTALGSGSAFTTLLRSLTNGLGVSASGLSGSLSLCHDGVRGFARTRRIVGSVLTTRHGGQRRHHGTTRTATRRVIRTIPTPARNDSNGD